MLRNICKNVLFGVSMFILRFPKGFPTCWYRSDLDQRHIFYLEIHVRIKINWTHITGWLFLYYLADSPLACPAPVMGCARWPSGPWTAQSESRCSCCAQSRLETSARQAQHIQYNRLEHFCERIAFVDLFWKYRLCRSLCKDRLSRSFCKGHLCRSFLQWLSMYRSLSCKGRLCRSLLKGSSFFHLIN